MHVAWKITPSQDPSSVTSVQTEYCWPSYKHEEDNLTSVPHLLSGCLVRMEIAQPWLAGRVPGNAGCPLLVHMGSRFPPCLVHLLEPIFPPVNTLWLWSKGRRLLTICCHANVDAFFKATFLALISGDFVYDTFSFIFTGIGWMEIFLNGSSKETLCEKERPKTTVSYFLEINDSSILSLPKCFF